MLSRPKPVVLLILDGWGIAPASVGNAITSAHTPTMHSLWAAYPHTQLVASGESVGLPKGEDGNTETGHLNIGAGSIVYQDLPRINMSIADGTFAKNPTFLQAFAHVVAHKSTLHLFGLIGSGGVHSNREHLFALLSNAKAYGLAPDQVLIHAFTDGRDSPPTSALSFLTQIEEHCKTLGVGKVASIIGRYYAMDRDKRWDRIERAYTALTIGSSLTALHAQDAIQDRYSAGETDEFFSPVSLLDPDGKPYTVKDNDAVIFFNFRIDRPRELTKAFILDTFEDGVQKEGFDPYTIKYEHTHIQQQKNGATFHRKKILQNLFFVTMTEYEKGLSAHVAFPPQTVSMPLARVISERGLRQMHMSETEKERFVTYYFNGLREEIFPGEDRDIIPSKKVATYDLAPEMSVHEITSQFLTHLQKNVYDFFCINLANADMVAHTGNFDATVQAVGHIDQSVAMIVQAVTLHGGIVLITADHGNAEELLNAQTGEIDTKHSTYPVPFLIVGKMFLNKPTMLQSGILADIAPTILKLLDIPKPASMIGRSIL